MHPSMYEELWVPDLIFANEKKGDFHTLTTDNRLLSLRNDGEVYTSIRKGLKFKISNIFVENTSKTELNAIII